MYWVRKTPDREKFELPLGQAINLSAHESSSMSSVSTQLNPAEHWIDYIKTFLSLKLLMIHLNSSKEINRTIVYTDEMQILTKKC